MRRLLLSLCALLLVPVVLPHANAEPTLLAGAAVVDDTWHVGAGAGQYATDGSPLANAATGGETDPNLHSTKSVPSYGVQSRLTTRAIVVQGSNGERIALLKTDNYLAQDLLLRRVAQLLSAAGSKVTYDHILYGVTHDHSSPYYATPAAGVWLFQDAVDLREFEYQARAMSRAVLLAESRLRPAKMGATTVPFSVYKGNIVGPDKADDGTPAGYPDKEGDNGLVVMSFVGLDGDPIATWMNWGQHPESLAAYDLISADYVGVLERFVDRETGAPLVFSQGDVGSSEGPYYGRAGQETLPDGVVRAWAHVGYAQMERGARYVADAVESGLATLRSGEGQVPYATDVPVGVYDRWTTGPVSHPYPSASNCRSQSTLDGDVGVPVSGVPDCDHFGPKGNLAPIAELLKDEGIPVPDTYDVPSFGTVEENLRLHLQALRIGEVLLASCACEAQVDLVKNLESRANNVTGDIYDGYDWSGQCSRLSPSSWSCPDPESRGARTLTVSDALYKHFAAQIHNDARGWDAPENAARALSESKDPASIFGNFTKEELSPSRGYALAVGIGHASDYNGYTVSYREYQSRETYRKALTSYGPHTADYMVTRLVRMAGALKGGPRLEDEPTAALGVADEARQNALAIALGKASSAALDDYEATLADDVGPAALLTKAKSITRFDGTFVRWRGGDNAVDQPRVRVERMVDDAWVPYADQTGEVPVMLALPKGVQGLAGSRTGSQEWVWTAAFEAYDGFPARLGATPDGRYRFVVDGVIRQGSKNVPYHFASEFLVTPWRGVRVTDMRAEDDGSVSFVASATYPRTYASPFRYVRDDGDTVLCMTCSFRPWAKSAPVEVAWVTVERDHGTDRIVRAEYRDGRWYADTALKKGERAYVAPGGVYDANGETNGTASDDVYGPTRSDA